MTYSMDAFKEACVSCENDRLDPLQAVERMKPHMSNLIQVKDSFLKECHFLSDSSSYTRNEIFCCPEGLFSLYSIVWLPGQWTPVHDHGTWGVVGVLEGQLYEREFHKVPGQKFEEGGYDLKSGSEVILTPGDVVTFVPKPDYIHISGVPETHQRAVSLHLYGREMDEFNVYDQKTGTCTPMSPDCNKSED